MDRSVDRFTVLLGHSFDACDSYSLSIFIRMSLFVQHSDNTFLSICDALNHDFNSFFAILVQDFKVLTKIVKMLAKRSITISDNEFDSIFVTVVVDEFLSG